MRSIWAVSRQTFIEVLRLRGTTFFMLGLAAVILLAPLITMSGSPRDRVQTFLVYSVGIASVMLSLLTILAGCKIICGEQAKRFIFAPLTKPIARWQYVVGRWSGLVLFQAMLIAFVGLAIYGSARILRGQIADKDQRFLVDNQVLTSRIKLRPSFHDEDIAKLAESLFNERKQGGRFEGFTPNQMISAHMSAEQDAQKMLEVVEPFGRLNWRFFDLPAPLSPHSWVELHFTVHSAKIPAGAGMQGVFAFSKDPNSSNAGDYYRWPQIGRTEMTFPIDQDASVLIPADMVSDGKLFVQFVHVRPGDPYNTFQAELNFAPEGFYLIYPIAHFEANFARVMLLVLIAQVFLAAVTLLAGTWLSFPVACLMCLVIYAIGYMQPFLVESTTIAYKSGFWVYVGHFVYGGLVHVLPNFDMVSTSDALSDALIIPWSGVAAAALMFVLFWTGLSLVIASLVFTRRELASVIVE